jgi:PIN domain nuclease of toxin-antitoxin system
MRALLDTHALIWFLEGDERLSGRGRETIARDDNEVLVSIVSIWEMSIKHGLGKFELGQPFADLIPKQLELNGFGVLGVELPHVIELGTLPYHHRDPFDRMIIAQARVENLPVIGDDGAFDAYGVQRIW